MIVTLQTAGLQTVAQVRAFVEGNAPVSFTLTDRTAAHLWMTETLQRFRYQHRTRADKGVLRRYLAKVTGLSRAVTVHEVRRLYGFLVDARAGFDTAGRWVAGW